MRGRSLIIAQQVQLVERSSFEDPVGMCISMFFPLVYNKLLVPVVAIEFPCCARITGFVFKASSELMTDSKSATATADQQSILEIILDFPQMPVYHCVDYG